MSMHCSNRYQSISQSPSQPASQRASCQPEHSATPTRLVLLLEPLLPLPHGGHRGALLLESRLEAERERGNDERIRSSYEESAGRGSDSDLGMEKQRTDSATDSCYQDLRGGTHGHTGYSNPARHQRHALTHAHPPSDSCLLHRLRWRITHRVTESNQTMSQLDQLPTDTSVKQQYPTRCTSTDLLWHLPSFK